jgi:dihydrolipoamide dehydrogenase
MPSKVLIETANAFHRRKVFDAFGISGADRIEMDIPSALRRVRRLRDNFVSGTLKATDKLGERSVTGRARFTSPNTLLVDGRTIHADKIIIATGSRPVVPAPWRELGDLVITTDTLFEMEDLPPNMAVIGLGALGIEMAQAISRLGINITAFDMKAQVAGLSDSEVSRAALEILSTEFAIHTGASTSVEASSGKLRIKAGDVSIGADKVLAALGRKPNVDDIGLENLGVELDERGLPPYDPGSLQIADLPVFIAGDASQYHPVLHEAADEGYIAGRNAVSPSPVCYKRRTPLSIVFIDPGAAMVGRRFETLDPDEYIVGEADFKGQGRAIAAAANRGLLRIYADKNSSLLLGAEMCVPGAEHLAHLLALAIDQRLGVNEMLRMPFYHPVIEEGLRSALRQLAKQFPSTPVSDLSGCEGFAPGAMG